MNKLIALALLAACSAQAQDIYRSGNAYSDQPGGAKVYIVDNTMAAVIYPDPWLAPALQPQRRHRPAPVTVVTNVTVNNPAPVIQPVYVIPQRNYLAAPGWRNPHGRQR